MASKTSEPPTKPWTCSFGTADDPRAARRSAFNASSSVQSGRRVVPGIRSVKAVGRARARHSTSSSSSGVCAVRLATISVRCRLAGFMVRLLSRSPRTLSSSVAAGQALPRKRSRAHGENSARRVTRIRLTMASTSRRRPRSARPLASVTLRARPPSARPRRAGCATRRPVRCGIGVRENRQLPSRGALTRCGWVTLRRVSARPNRVRCPTAGWS